MNAKNPDVSARVRGLGCASLYVSFREVVFLITEAEGTHSVGRVFVVDGVTRAGDRLDNRIGPGVVLSVDFNPETGCEINTTRGTMFIPAGNCYATWTLSPPAA